VSCNSLDAIQKRDENACAQNHDGNENGSSLIRIELMMNRSALTRFAAALGLVISLQGGSAAPAANEQMGLQSGAAIQISVRVMPSFSIKGSNAPVTVGRIGNAAALDFSSNMAGLRFDVIAVSGASEKVLTKPKVARPGATFQHSNEPRLFLVVPD
jgi:hypothetical protein